MDPLTQGLFGATAAQLPAEKQNIAKASLIGALAGMAPDLDVFIRSSNDSLLALEYHRHCTHSLFFIPIGGALCGLLFYLLLAKVWRLSLNQCFIWSVLGFATHGLLDGCTSYGTRLLWPFSDARIAWDLVSVIDPLFSAILLVAIVLAMIMRRKEFTCVAAGWVVVYLSVASTQHSRALFWGEQLALQRNHTIEVLQAKPSFGNIIVWKTIYLSDGIYYVDAVKPTWTAAVRWYGESIPQLDISRDLPWLELNSQQATDIERFRHFSAGFIAIDPRYPNRIGDVRYSQLPHQIDPLWGIELNPTAETDQHAIYITDRSGSRDALPTLLKMIF